MEIKTKKNSKIGIAYLIGNVFDKAIAFVTIPIFTRLLSTEEYGVTTTYLSWVSILSVLLTLSLGNSVRTALTDFPKEENQYLSSIFFVGTISAFAMTTIVGLFSIVLKQTDYLLLILCCCFHSYGSSIIISIQWKHMMKLEYIKRVLLQSLPNVVVVFLSILLINSMNNNKYYGRIIAYTIVFGILGLTYVFYYLMKGRCFFNKKFLKYAFAFSLPLIVHSLSTVVLSQSDRIMISMLYNTSEAGIYGLAYQFGMLPLVITTTLENIWIPWFTKKIDSNFIVDINNAIKPYIYIACIFCICIMLVSPEALILMSTNEFAPAIYMISPVVLATFFIFLASIPIDYEYYKKKTLFIAINTIIAAIINIILNLIFIPKYGGLAASYTTVFSYFVSFLIHYIYTKKENSKLFCCKPFIVSICIGVTFAILTNLLMNFAIIRWSLGIIIVFISVILIFYNKNKLFLIKE